MQTTSMYSSLSHSKWDCKYHVVFIPKCRKKELYEKIRKYLGTVFHELAGQRECKIVEGHMMLDHVHMLIKIPPKYSVSKVIGYIKGKSAIAIARQFGGRTRNFNGEKFWARGYCRKRRFNYNSTKLCFIANLTRSTLLFRFSF